MICQPVNHLLFLLDPLLLIGVHWFQTLAASPLFWLPPIREVSIMLGAVDASRQYASQALENGYSICVFPGESAVA